jgi:signal transduction histidine kinase
MANTEHQTGSADSLPAPAPVSAQAPGPDSKRTPAPELGSATATPAIEELVERLSAHRTFGGSPTEELRWLANHGELRRYEAGHVVSTPSMPVEGMFVILSGRISIHLIRGNARHKIAEWRGGDVTGVLPYSRLVTPPGDTIVDETAEVLVVGRDALPAMVRECQAITSILVHVMLDRARFFTSNLLHDEKLKSLGKLAAGLAHELNNPAAAITRSAKMLRKTVESASAAARALGAAGLTAAEQEAISRMSIDCLPAPAEHVLSPLAEAEREAALTDWLESRGLDAAAAESIAQTPVTTRALEELAAQLRPGILGHALQWVAADCAARGLAAEIETAGTRISDLVTAVRGFTQVDVDTLPQPIDIAEGLGQTFAVLRGKARGKSVRMAVTIESGLPRVRGVAAELNQVWANLIDNALDAVPASGSVEVTASRENARVVVRVADDGPGIPPDVRDRIFDPFFTTKGVGEGTGLGLSVSYGIVRDHRGTIEVDTTPGRGSRFTVLLPLAD